MSSRRRKRAPKGLVWRSGRAYFDRRHSRFKGGRLAISLRTDDPDVATERHTVLTQLMDRGDWGVIEAIRSGDMHISDAQAAFTVIENHIRRGYAGERYLIVSPHRGDQPVTGGTSARWTREAFGLAGIKYGREGDGLTLHSGRHTYASWLAQDGVPLNVIATLLGDTTKVVEETYAHLIPDTYRAAVQAIERRLQG